MLTRRSAWSRGLSWPMRARSAARLHVAQLSAASTLNLLAVSADWTALAASWPAFAHDSDSAVAFFAGADPYPL